MIEKNDALADEGDELFCCAFDKRRGSKLISDLFLAVTNPNLVSTGFVPELILDP